MALNRETVLLLSPDPELLGQVLGRSAHELAAERVGQPFPDAVEELGMAEPLAPAHVS